MARAQSLISPWWCPTLNEAENVDSLLARLFQAFREEGREIEVLFADGGSTDGTQEKVQAWASKAPVRLVDARSGRGLAGDVVVAAREARADVIVVMDGDLSHSPEAAPRWPGRCWRAAGTW